jgi:CheY-like chemotaxis protein
MVVMTKGPLAARILREGSYELLHDWTEQLWQPGVQRRELTTEAELRRQGREVLDLLRDAALRGDLATFAADAAAEGRGSLCTVRLPLVRGAGASPPARPPPPVSAEDARRRAGEAGRPAVLVVEDNEDAREMLALLLEGRGYPVGTAADGPEGVAKGSSGDWDVAVVDIGLPGLDGYQVAQRLRAAEGGEDLVLIALSGYGRPEDRAHSRESGFDRHLVKPVEPQQLFDLLERVGAARRRR